MKNLVKCVAVAFSVIALASCGTTKANPQIAAVRTSPAPKIIESSLFSIADKIISFQSTGQYGRANASGQTHVKTLSDKITESVKF